MNDKIWFIRVEPKLFEFGFASFGNFVKLKNFVLIFSSLLNCRSIDRVSFILRSLCCFSCSITIYRILLWSHNSQCIPCMHGGLQKKLENLNCLFCKMALKAFDWWFMICGKIVSIVTLISFHCSNCSIARVM